MSPEDDPNQVNAARRVAESGREAVRQVWARRDERDTLPEPMRRLLEILEQHKEFRPFWEGAEPDESQNPFLHVVYHQVLRDQLASGDPPESREAIDRLTASGTDRHEAEHKVMQLLIMEMYDMVQRRGPFDRDRYRTRLAELR